MRAVIAGAAMSRLKKRWDRGPVGLAAPVLDQALADARLDTEDVDGLLVHIGSPRGQDYDRVAESLGLSVGFAAQAWSHGRFMSTTVVHAALAVNAGLAENIACIAAYRNSAFPRIGEPGNPFFDEVLREGGGPHGEQGHVGMLAPAGGAAMAWRRYTQRYPVDAAVLVEVATRLREAAMLNPLAVMREPITAREYDASPYVVEPLRRLDCSIPVDGAACVIVARQENAQDPTRAIPIAGIQGLRAGREQYIFGPSGLGLWQQSCNRPPLESARAQPAYHAAGVEVDDIDLFYTYDAFTPLVPFALEEFGFIAPGEAAKNITDGGLVRDGRLWVNTNGGLLSEGHFNGWGHLIEMVSQLRGEAEKRQTPGPEIAVWGALAGDALVLRAP